MICECCSDLTIDVYEDSCGKGAFRIEGDIKDSLTIPVAYVEGFRYPPLFINRLFVSKSLLLFFFLWCSRYRTRTYKFTRLSLKLHTMPIDAVNSGELDLN